MKLLINPLFTSLFTVIIAGCTRQMPLENNSNILPSSARSDAAIDEGYVSPPQLVKAYVAEPLPQRPYQLVEFINTQRAYNNLTGTGSRSYYYARRSNVPTDHTGGATVSTMLVDFEAGYQRPLLDVRSMVACFSSMSDAGAQCTIELMADIPVDGNPNVMFDWGTGSPGHCFLRLRKTTGGATMSRTIGFYPESALKAGLTTAPIAGKFVDNSGHEYNASIRMPLSAADFRKLLGVIVLRTKVAHYDIDDYNCTDFALEIFNSLRPDDPIMPRRQRIPNTVTTAGSLTPQGLYTELLRRKAIDPLNKFYIRSSIGKLFCPPLAKPCP